MIFELPIYAELRSAYELIQNDEFFQFWKPNSDIKVRILEAIKKEMLRLEQQLMEEASKNGDQVSD